MKWNQDQINIMRILSLIVVGNAFYQTVKVVFYDKQVTDAFESWLAGTIDVFIIGFLFVVGSHTVKRKE